MCHVYHNLLQQPSNRFKQSSYTYQRGPRPIWATLEDLSFFPNLPNLISAQFGVQLQSVSFKLRRFYHLGQFQRM
jgi:hypothetical protein